ncbi:hypothetical protein AAVH_17549 [Aphelenchoides avenae]|nr:hypothetical protein AAVH_17549 [Aphelenchus avenae]
MGKRKRCSSRMRAPDKDSCPCGYNCGYYFLRCDHCHRGCHFQCLGLKVDEARHLSVYVCPTCKRDGVEIAYVEAKCRAGNKPRAVVYEVLCNVHAEKAAQKERTQKCYAIGYGLEDSPPLEDDPCCICECVCKWQQVACDKCDLNYHCMCVGLSEKDVDGIDAFYCPKCLATNPQLRITYKDAGGAEEEGHPVEEDHAEAPDQPGPSGVQTG